MEMHCFKLNELYTCLNTNRYYFQDAIMMHQQINNNERITHMENVLKSLLDASVRVFFPLIAQVENCKESASWHPVTVNGLFIDPARKKNSWESLKAFALLHDFLFFKKGTSSQI